MITLRLITLEIKFDYLSNTFAEDDIANQTENENEQDQKRNLQIFFIRHRYFVV